MHYKRIRKICHQKSDLSSILKSALSSTRSPIKSFTNSAARIIPATEGANTVDPGTDAQVFIGFSSEQTTLSLSIPLLLHSLRITLARGSMLVSAISFTRKHPGSVLLPAPIDEITGTPHRLACAMISNLAVTVSTASTT